MVEKEGMKFDNGKVDWTLIPFRALEGAVKVLMHGAHKYERNNWKKVMPRDRYMKALLRHVVEAQEEQFDKDSGLSHLSHVIVNALFLEYFEQQEKCYIAGPMRGQEDFNRSNFMKWEKILIEEGFNVINPIRLSEQVRKEFESPTWEMYMIRDIKEMVDCSHIFMLNGWGKSRGAFLEHQIAEALKMNVMFEGEERWQKKL